MLTLAKSQQIVQRHISQPHLINHSLAVSAAMGAMAEFFNADIEHWQAIGYIHDIDFEKFPESHLDHVEELLAGEDITDEELRAIKAHGFGIRNEVEPLTEMEKSLYTVDELTGIIGATALMRPTGITDLTVKSVMKKFKDKQFAAKCDRDLIRGGCERLGLELNQVIELCIKGMQTKTAELGLGIKE